MNNVSVKTPSITPKLKYDEFLKVNIGNSDSGILMFKGKEKPSTFKISNIPVSFEEAGPYEAYFVNYRTDIPDDFTLIATFYGNIEVIGDEDKPSFMFGADKIEIYRRGNKECIIKLYAYRIMSREKSVIEQETIANNA